MGAAYGLAETYTYYRERHSRNSVDGNGGNIIGIVRFGLQWQNAMWNQGIKMMIFGDNFSFTNGKIDNSGTANATAAATNHRAALIGAGAPCLAANMTTAWRFEGVQTLIRNSAGILVPGQNRLTAFDATTYAEVWRYGEGEGPYNGEIISSPVYGDGMIFFQLWRESRIHAVRLTGHDLAHCGRS